MPDGVTWVPMASAAKSSPEAVAPSAPLKAPKLLVEWQPASSAFVENLRAVLFRPRPMTLSSRPGTYWADVFVHRPLAKREIALSYLLHALAISIVYLYPWVGMLTPHAPTQDPTKDTTITYYKLSEYLPSIQSSSAPAKMPRKGEPAQAKQLIISVPSMPDNLEQTIVDPNSIAVIRQHVDVPNMVVMTPIPAAPIAANPGVPKLVLPPEIRVVAPAADPVANKLAEMKLPKIPDQQLVQPAPDTTDLKTKLSDMNIAQLDPTVAEPKITLTPVRALPKLEPGKGEAAAAPAPPPGSGTNANAVGQMITLGINPTMPSGPVNVPSGNRRGELAAGPEGKAGAPGTPEIKAGGSGNGGEGTKPDGGNAKNGDANSPGISVAGPANADNASVIAAAAPPPPSKPALTPAQKQMLASVAHPSLADLARGTAADRTLPDAPSGVDRVFGTKKFYSMTLNMPNLTSAGGSWIVRFAELTETHTAGELTAPVALTKVDPAYPQELMRDRIEGTVTVYAVIHSDGTVGELKVLRGVDDRLDANAMNALSHWKFRPGTKNGAPVELEAVVQIPFVLRKEQRY